MGDSTSSEPKPAAAAPEESSNQPSEPKPAAAAAEKNINQPAYPSGALPQTRLITSGSQDKQLRILCLHGHNSNRSAAPPLCMAPHHVHLAATSPKSRPLH
jgi:hypothetical protein